MPAVLIVDEDERALADLQGTLETAGYEVCAALTAVAALQLLERRPFDVVVLELLLPDKDGIETLLEIRQRWPAMPVLAVCGGGMWVRAEQVLPIATALGAEAAMQKPLSPAELLAALTKCLNRRAA